MENQSLKPDGFTKVKKVKPTHVGQKCPVCNSFGTVGHIKKICHGCQGKGYVLVPATEVEDKNDW